MLKKELESRVLKRNKNRHTKTIYVESTTHIRQKKKYITCGLAKKLGVYFLQFCVQFVGLDLVKPTGVENVLSFKCKDSYKKLQIFTITPKT